MSNILFIKQGSKVRTSNNNICVELDSENYLVPYNEVEIIIVENYQCSLTAGLIIECNRNGIPVVFCDNKHTPVVSTNSLYTYYKQTTRVQEQINWTKSKKEKLFLKIIIQKCINQFNMILHTGNCDEEIDYSKFLDIINRENVSSIEAQVAKMYFKEVFGEDFKRHSEDDINYLLNYGYAILRSKIRQIIIAKGLHPSIGIAHYNQFNNFNLSDDIIEVYRSIVDYIVFELMKTNSDKEKSREVLQQVILQDVEYANSKISVIKSIELFIDGIIRYLNGTDKDIAIPKLEINYYEFQI